MKTMLFVLCREGCKAVALVGLKPQARFPHLGLVEFWGSCDAGQQRVKKDHPRSHSSHRAQHSPVTLHQSREVAMADRASKRMRRVSTEYEESEGADEWMNSK
jgi:hypothetical protein